LKALEHRPGIPALVMAYSIGYGSEVAAGFLAASRSWTSIAAPNGS
jgi:hypothetical protein